MKKMEKMKCSFLNSFIGKFHLEVGSRVIRTAQGLPRSETALIEKIMLFLFH